MRSSEGTDEEALRRYGNKFCEIPPRGPAMMKTIRQGGLFSAPRLAKAKKSEG